LTIGRHVTTQGQLQNSAVNALIPAGRRSSLETLLVVLTRTPAGRSEQIEMAAPRERTAAITAVPASPRKLWMRTK